MKKVLFFALLIVSFGASAQYFPAKPYTPLGSAKVYTAPKYLNADSAIKSPLVITGTRPANDSSKAAATTEWVMQRNNVLYPTKTWEQTLNAGQILSSNHTIGGTAHDIIFQDFSNLIFKRQAGTFGTTDYLHNSLITLADTGTFLTYTNDSGRLETRLRVNQSGFEFTTNDTVKSKSIFITRDSILLSRTPEAGDSTNNIATTAFVKGRIASIPAGSGTVIGVSATAPLSITNVATINPNVVADTSKAQGRLATYNDVLLKSNVSDTAAMLTPYLRTGSIAWSGTLFTTPTAGVVSGHNITYSPALASQGAYTLFGRGSGSGTPSFLSSIDSNWVSGLHSENYYKTKFAQYASSWTVNGSDIYNNNTGKVGVGTKTPLGKLDIFSSAINTPLLSFDRPSDSTQKAGWFSINSIDEFIFNTNNAGLDFLTNWNSGSPLSTMRLSNTGYVTIGAISSLTTPLTVNSLSNKAISMRNGGVSERFNLFVGTGSPYSADDNYISSLNTTLHFLGGASGATEIMTLLSNGNLGINNTSPATLLDIASTTKGILIPRMTTTQRDAVASPATGLQLYNTTANANNTYNSTNWVGGLTVSSAGTLTLIHGQDYVFTGTTSTWTLPAVSATILGRQNGIKIKNRGSGAITLNSNTGSTLYNTAAVGTITIAAGASVELLPDGTYFDILFNL